MPSIRSSGSTPLPDPSEQIARPTSYQAHAARWKDCTACRLCEGRSKVVLARGRLPCDVLFIGEAPGESEDALGLPFIGPAGKLLDRIVSEALDGIALCSTCGTVRTYREEPGRRVGKVIISSGEKDWVCRNGHAWSQGHGGRDVYIAFTNLVGCVPRDEEGGKVGEPPPEAIEACAPRLEEIVALAKPRLLVCVGQLSCNWIMRTPSTSARPRSNKHYLLLDYEGPMVDIIHPAAILRANVANQELAIQRAVIALRDAAEEL